MTIRCSDVDGGETEGDRVEASVSPATPIFTVESLVVTVGCGSEIGPDAEAEPGSNVVTVTGTIPAKSNPRKLILAIQEPALHAARC